MKYLALIKNYFSGKKTYIVGVIASSYGVLTVFDVIAFTPEQEKSIFIFLTALFGITIRASITKIKN